MSETLFNLFVYVNGKHVVALGAKVYEREEDEAECLTFLKQMVPHDALTAKRYTLSASEATETLPCGTVGLPVRHYKALKASGRPLDLFEPIFKLHDAPESLLACVTTVQDGVPINDDGPIYEGGTSESDRRFRHKIVLSILIEKAGEVLRSAAQEGGPGVFVLTPAPQTIDYENRAVSYLKEADFTDGVKWGYIRGLLSVYNPASEGIFFFDDPEHDDAYRVQWPPDCGALGETDGSA